MPPSGLRGLGVGLPLGPPRPPPITVMPQMVAAVPGGMMHPPGGGMGHVPGPPHLQRRPLLLQEQPLLLEDLLEQEKREQEKQQQQQPPPASASPPLLSDVDFERLRADVLGTTTPTGGSPGLGSPPQGIPAQGLLPSPNLVSVVGTNLRPPYPPRPAPQTTSKLIEWQSGPSSGLDSKMGPSGVLVRQQSTPGEATAGRVPLFNAPHLPTPPLPPENIMTEQDRQTQLHYEQWLNHQNQIVSSQLKYYETEVSKLRKIRKSLNSKQRQLRKSGNELTEADALELQRISSEQSVLQKQLDASRKQSRQHGMLIQEYRNKQQQKQRQQQGPGSVGPPSLLIGPPVLGSSTPQQQSVVIHSPLGRPASSPVHHPSTPQSPMMSPSPSPMMQQHPSPLHSPGPLLSHSPGPGSVTCMLQHSPGNPGPGSSSGMSPHSLQPSPRMGTPHSQSEESPFSPGTPQEMLRSLPSPQQVCPPPAGRLASPQGHGAPRMTSPQHRMGVPTPQGMGRLVTSPVSYTGDHRTVQQQFSGGEQIRINMPPRFVRSPISGNSEPALLRPRGLPIQGPGQMGPTNVMYSQPSPTQNVRAGIVYSSSSSPSPLGSPQSVVSNVVGQQQQFQQITSQSGQQQTGHSQQQTSVHFQQAQTGVSGQMVVRQVQQSVGQQSPQQMVQRQLQQHLLQQQQQPQEQEANLLLAQRQQLQLAQQRQMIHQQRQQILQHQQLAQQRQQQQMLQQQPNQPPSSPMPPRSPIIHQQHQNSNLPSSSPMPPRSPMVQSLNQSQTPNSPVPPHSPMLQQMNQTQPLNSPMPPCSPVVQQQYQQIGQNQPPSSPVLRNSMVQNLPHSVGSPMQMRHPSSTGSVSNSPVLPDRPQSVENPLTPRTPHTPHTPQSSQQGGEFGQGHLEHQDNDTAPGGGGGNPNNPANPLPLPAMFGRFGYFKLGLRGGSPMWSTGTGFRRGGRHGSSKCNDEKGNGSGEHQDKDAGVGTCGTKTKGQVESKSALQSCSSARETRSIVTPGKTVAVVSKVASLVCVDYNDFDDENSHTPPLTPPPSQAHEVCVPSSVLIVDNKEENLSGVAKIISEQDLSSTEKSDESASEKSSVLVEIEKEVSSNTKELIGEKCGEEIEVSVISHEDILDSDTVVSSDLAIEDADCDNVVVFESDLAQVSSSIDTDVIEECIVTSSDIVMDISVVDALGDCDKLTSCIQKDDDILHLVDEESKVESGDIMETADVDDELGEIELAEGNDDMPNMDMDVMHILDSRVTGMLDRDPVLDMPEGCREIHSMNERLRIDCCNY
ncbi:histone-lysine N-methyltransferase 2D-like [Zootermopsis nevadensis]|uniref:histone-lysine N-methyltransferase 2D-like n=1 Tax=Zootermopsis nevadensis TaxID=136037 RepID=UPI000B8E3F4A|nr:histone-lysine N-methyltransferase 2D-like [Zootermopsis nevadensis]